LTYTTVSVVDSDGQIPDGLILGDDYIYPVRGLVWTIAPLTGVNIGTATCWLGFHFKGEYTLMPQGTIVAVGANWELRFDITRAYTDNLDPGWYQFSIEIKHGAYEVTRVLSDCNVQMKRKWVGNESTTGEIIDCGFPDSVFDAQFGQALDGGSP